jgi:hypothetical protein
VAPPLPFPGDPGTISGWLLDQSLLATSSLIVHDIELGFARLSEGIPVDPLDPDYLGAMREMVDKVSNSTDLCYYLTVSKTGAAVAARVTIAQSIRKYSTGFGALSAFQGAIMGFLGETIGDNMPLFIQAPTSVADKNLVLSFTLRVMLVPTDDELLAYFTLYI